MNTAPAYTADASQMHAAPATQDNGYGRARLRIGITGVGLWVAVAIVALASGVTGSISNQLPAGITGDVAIIGLMLAIYVVLQLPLDWLGGYRVPKQFGRQVPSATAYTKGLALGITVHTLILFISASVLYLGGKLGGIGGAFIAGILWMLVLATARGVLAHLTAKLSPTTLIRDKAGVELLESDDEGFTGGINGLINPRANILPAAWRDKLSPEQFELAIRRRQRVIESGAWRQGRLGAFIFTTVGLLLALLLAGSDAAGTGAGVVETALWFTLWSFAGLLILPTLSRAAIYRTDQQLIQDGADPQLFDQLTHTLDGYQDGEPRRGRWVERIFHPIPSASNRSVTKMRKDGGFWDIARTSVYLGIGSVSLLTRSVHCNVGRPALWVWLPTE